MKSNAKRELLRGVVLFLAIAFAMTGCATAPGIAEQALQANLAAEGAQNQTMLLNVIRAVERKPMHFTGITQITGTLTTDRPSLTIAGNVGKDVLQDIATLTLGIQPNRPSYTVAVWDTAKFQRGISKSVDPTTLKFFLDQGWPAVMTLAMFIRELQIVRVRDDVVTKGANFLNYPGERSDYSGFVRELDLLQQCGIELEMQPAARAFGPALELPAAANLEHLVGAAVAKLEMTEDKAKKTWRLQRPGREVVLKLHRRGNPKACMQSVIAQEFCKVRKGEEPSSPSAGLRTLSEFSTLLQESKSKAEIKPGCDSVNADENGEAAVVMQLRSPASMLYFLGEVSRAQLGEPFGSDKTYVPQIPVGKRGLTNADCNGEGAERESTCQPLFRVLRGNLEESPAVKIDYRGVTYSVPSAPKDHGRSMQAMTLAAQLVNMLKESDDLPAVSTVRLIGQ